MDFYLQTHRIDAACQGGCYAQVGYLCCRLDGTRLASRVQWFGDTRFGTETMFPER